MGMFRTFFVVFFLCVFEFNDLSVVDAFLFYFFFLLFCDYVKLSMCDFT